MLLLVHTLITAVKYSDVFGEIQSKPLQKLQNRAADVHYSVALQALGRNTLKPLSGSVADLLQIENRAIFLQAGPGCYFYPQCYAAPVVHIVAMAKIFNKSGFVLRK